MSKKEANALSPADLRWNSSSKNLMEQVEIGRDTGCVDGFMFYRYDNMVSSKQSKEMKTKDEVEKALKRYETLSDTVLVIDGNTMNIALLPENEQFKIFVSLILYKLLSR